MTDHPDPEELLRAQLSDLARLRTAVQAQRASLQMDDPALLDTFAREATEIAAGVLARDKVLLAVREAAQHVGMHPARTTSLARLAAEVERTKLQAGTEAGGLARQMEASAHAIARELAEVNARLEGMVTPYGTPRITGEPVIMDRTA
jgi:ribosomal protein S9